MVVEEHKWGGAQDKRKSDVVMKEARKEVGILWFLGSMFQEQGGGGRRRGKKCAVGVICGDCLLC